MRAAFQRAFLALALSIGASLPAHADALTLAVPPVAMWEAQGLSEPVELKFTVPMDADQWRLALYRSGDSARKLLLKDFQGAPIRGTLSRSWDGQVKAGPEIRPGERITAVLSVRDAAGNINEAPGQTILFARYLMAREKKTYAAAQKKRAASLGADGSLLAVNGIPITIGSALVRGSGTLERIQTGEALPKLAGHQPDGWVDGQAALALSLRNDSGEGRALLAAIDTQQPQMIYKDARLSRVLNARQDSASLLEQRAPQSEPPPTHKIRVLYPLKAAEGLKLTLPHTDIRPGTLKMSIALGEVPFRTLIPGRHFATRFIEGRLGFTALTSEFVNEASADSKQYGNTPELLVQYEVFALDTDAQRQFTSTSDGAEWARSNAQRDSDFTRRTPHGQPEREPTPLDRFLAFLGMG